MLFRRRRRGASQPAHGLDIPMGYFGHIRMIGDGALDAFLSKKVQGRVRGAVRAVRDIVRSRLCKLILRMEAGDLDVPVEPELPEGVVGNVEEVVELQEISQDARMDQVVST
jgi:hypothetical protein